MHVKGFGDFPAHVAGKDAVGGWIVGPDWSGQLRVAHLNHGHVDGNRLLAVEEYRTGLSLSGRCHDDADGLALGEYWAVWSGSRSDGVRGGVLIR